MPGFYADGEYDIAGFIVGVVERVEGRSTAAAIVPGDVLIGLPSAGLHTNGYSLARRVLFEIAGLDARHARPRARRDGRRRAARAASLVSAAGAAAARTRLVKGMAHITGGGITENLPRVLPEGCAAEIDLRSWTVPPLFQLLQERGGIATDEMFRAFNMGVGLVLVCAAARRRARHQHAVAGGRAECVPARVRRRGRSSLRRAATSSTAARRPDLRPRQQPPVDHRRGCRPGGSTRRSRS